VTRTPTPDEARRAVEAAAGVGAKEAKEAKKAPVPVPSSGIYHGILGDITMAAEPTTEADPVGIHVSLLTGVSADLGPISALHPRAYLRIGNDRHPLLIWGALFGRTSTGRKGGAFSTADLFLARACLSYAGYVTSGLSSGEGLIERIRDGDSKDSGIDDKRLLVIEPEFGSVMARMKREGSTLATALRQAWDGSPLRVMNRKQYGAAWSHIAVLASITPREFRMRLAESDMAGGTYNRFLPVYVERSKRLPLPEGVDDATVERLSADLGSRLATAYGIAGQIGMTDDAKAVWCGELYDEFTPDVEDEAWAEFTTRAASYCQRIAAVYAVLDGRQNISKDDLAAAGALVRYSLASARYILDGMHRDPRMDRLIRAIDAMPPGLTRTEISALFGRHLPREALDELLDDLTGSGGYEVIRVETGGRPTEMYRKASFA
jgi:hypothetical protein